MAASLELEYPFAGRWLVRNSPADRVPSHGTTRFASSHAIDFVPVDDAGRTAPFTFASLLSPERPQRFPGFGRAIVAPVAGLIVAVHDSEPDHAAHRGVPSIGYAFTQSRRAAQGWIALAGNHALIDAGGVIVALCHLQQGSVAVRVGQQVRPGEAIGRCGNSGNSMQPHLHVQAVDRADIDRARAVPMTFSGGMPRNGQIVDAGAS
ncbi:M23 family metallopeptidase [Microbacterium sp. NPDC058345]|uniref:M23 family metallopeptidase n=1 Tax=Microbacterium sp. NPDC058345 TaxID=3346455 RepID=UPI003667B11A